MLDVSVKQLCLYKGCSTDQLMKCHSCVLHVCVYKCVCMCVYVSVCMRRCVFVVSVCVYVCVCMHACKQDMCAHTSMNVCVCVCATV